MAYKDENTVEMLIYKCSYLYSNQFITKIKEGNIKNIDAGQEIEYCKY